MWYYQNAIIDSIEQFPSDAVGFIYKIENKETGKFYIGRKNLYSERNVKLGKKESAAIAEEKRPGRKPTKKKVIKESDWKTYYGSEKKLLADVAELGADAFRRDIIHLCYTKKQITYQEIRYQILNGVLESDNCYNDNISGYYFRKDLLVS